MKSPDSHFDELERRISSNPLVIFHDLKKSQTSPSTLYVKGEIVFVDGTSLAIFQHIRMIEAGAIITDYRYHYMNFENQMIFRYDNAPHHDELETHPHHKHVGEKIIAHNQPHFTAVMDEAVSLVVENIL